MSDESVGVQPRKWWAGLGWKLFVAFALVIAVGVVTLGISAEDLSQVFERFYRVDRSRSRALGGMRLNWSVSDTTRH